MILPITENNLIIDQLNDRQVLLFHDFKQIETQSNIESIVIEQSNHSNLIFSNSNNENILVFETEKDIVEVREIIESSVSWIENLSLIIEQPELIQSLLFGPAISLSSESLPPSSSSNSYFPSGW